VPESKYRLVLEQLQKQHEQLQKQHAEMEALKAQLASTPDNSNLDASSRRGQRRSRESDDDGKESAGSQLVSPSWHARDWAGKATMNNIISTLARQACV